MSDTWLNHQHSLGNHPNPPNSNAIPASTALATCCAINCTNYDLLSILGKTEMSDIANDNEELSENESFCENILEDLLAEAAEDNPIDPCEALIELGARAMARAVLDYEVYPRDAASMTHARFMNIIKQAVDRLEADEPKHLRIVSTDIDC